jgi:hypothetical protein
VPVIFKALAPQIGIGPQAPGAPVLSLGTVTSSTVALSWTAPLGSLTYNVYQNGVRILTGLVGTSTTIGGLSPSTTYNFSVTAVNAVGEGVKSNVVNVTTSSSSQFVAPVTWMTAIQSPQATNYSSSTWRQLASKYNLVLFSIDANTDGAMTGGQTVASSMADVQSRATAQGNSSCRTGIYTINERSFNSFGSYPQFRALCNTWNWWLRSAPYPTGAIVTGDSGTSQLTNNSIFSPRATSGIANGKNVNEYFADYTQACFINGNGASVGEASFTMHANPACSFIIRDNQFVGTRSAGAWKDDATSYPSEFNAGPFQIATFLQQGHAQDVNRMRGNNPALLYGGNCDIVAYPASGGSAPPVDPTYLNLMDLPFAEAMIGTTFSSYTFDTFQGLINRMIRLELTLKSGGVPVFNNHTGPAPLNSSTNILWPNSQANWTNTFTCGFGTQSGWSANFWQGARFIICTGLLRGHAVCIEADSGQGSIWFYMDEFNNGNANTVNWFGAPQGPYPSAPTFSIGPLGVWMMTYQNVRVLVNPVGNGAVSLPASLSGHKLPAGPFCDPAVNNGAAFGNTYSAGALTMNNGDGMVVLP